MHHSSTSAAGVAEMTASGTSGYSRLSSLTPEMPTVSGSFRSRQNSSGAPRVSTARSRSDSCDSSTTSEPGRTRRSSITTASRIKGWSSMT